MLTCLFQVDIGESLAARTEILGTFRELGPPDLCHVVKTTGSRTSSKEIGSYHYCSGVEASSSASLAAYLNSLTFAVEETGTWFTGKGSGWKVTQGTYCCFNAFSRVDVRVEVKIPGGVDAYVVDLRGERHEASPQIWQETYLSALLRAIRYADDPSYKLAGYRKLDPITSLEGELRFLEAAEALFFKGWQLGSDPEIQVATVISNHLTAGVLKYFGDAYRFEPAANLFEKLVDKEPEVASLLAKAYIGMNEEVRAIQVLSAAIKQNPQSYSLLHVQCDFLRSKGRNDWALKLAKQAVNCAPSEFVTWAKLTEVYIDLGMYDSALLTLNSCPMFTFNERDLHRMPTPSRTHLPVKQFIAASNILDEDAARDNEADVALLRLPAGGLRGTFALAYAILTKIVAKIGWDDLLKTRSSVFVMEEEYRKHKAKASVGAGLASADADGVGSSNDSGAGADDDASTRSIRSPAPPPIDTQVNGHSADALGIPENSIPTIKVSSESDHEREHALLAKHARGESIGVSPVKEDSEAEARAEQEDKDIHRNASMEAPVVEKPEQAHAMPTATTMTTITTDVDAAAEEVPENSLDLKVLCERWLDGLFGTLYEVSCFRVSCRVRG